MAGGWGQGGWDGKGEGIGEGCFLGAWVGGFLLFLGGRLGRRRAGFVGLS